MDDGGQSSSQSAAKDFLVTRPAEATAAKQANAMKTFMIVTNELCISACLLYAKNVLIFSTFHTAIFFYEKAKFQSPTTILNIVCYLFSFL